MRFPLVLPFLLIVLLSCKRTGPRSAYTRDSENCYYRLIAFEEKADTITRPAILQVQASFCTQEDSVFWDSHNNLRDLYLLQRSENPGDFLTRYISEAAVGDSVELLVPVKLFFRTLFAQENQAYFTKGDSVVRIHLKVLREVHADFLKKGEEKAESGEYAVIESWFNDPAQYELARDADGFFWISGRYPQGQRETIEFGDMVRLKYQGFFLNGRPLDLSASELEFEYGNPDQILPGLNIVISKLTDGQNAKIILPSRLAFGAAGSSNGVVPPYTPLIYEVTVTKAQQTN